MSWSTRPVVSRRTRAAQIVLVAEMVAVAAAVAAAVATLWIPLDQISGTWPFTIADQTALVAPPRRSDGALAAIPSTARPARTPSPAATDAPPTGPIAVASPVAGPASPRPSVMATASTRTAPSPSEAAHAPSAAPANSPAVPAPTGIIRPVPIDGRLTQVVIRPWVDEFGQTRAQVVAQVTNRSAAAVTFRSSTYRVLDVRGREVARGVFSHVFPPVVMPGGHGYMVDTLRAVFAPVDDLARVTTRVTAIAAATGAVQRAKDIRVEAVKWSTTDGGGLRATGIVRNAGSVEQTEVATAVVLFGRDDELLGLLYDLTDASTLRPGSVTPFDTDYPGTAPTDPKDVRRAEGIAGSLGD